jgi:uncharacterized membrane protein YjjP (DUF1212 family)
MKNRNKAEYPRISFIFHYLFLASIFGPPVHLFHGRISDWALSTLLSIIVLTTISRRYSGLNIQGVVSAFVISCAIFYLAYFLPDSRYKLLPGIAWFGYFAYFVLAGPGKDVYELMCAHDRKGTCG